MSTLTAIIAGLGLCCLAHFTIGASFLDKAKAVHKNEQPSLTVTWSGITYQVFGIIPRSSVNVDEKKKIVNLRLDLKRLTMLPAADKITSQVYQLAIPVDGTGKQNLAAATVEEVHNVPSQFDAQTANVALDANMKQALAKAAVARIMT